MKVSSKAEYAVRAMVEIASINGRGTLDASEIAARQGIPKRYLEHLLLLLKKVGLLNSFRGKEGGYNLAKRPGDISVKEIVEAVEGPVEFFPRKGRRAKDFTFRVWDKVKEKISETLESVTLDSLVAERKRAEKAADYQI